jgi:Xaa-Pro aminopeptidase
LHVNEDEKALVWFRGDSKQEVQSRVLRAQGAMREAGLDALLLTTEANVRYFSGYHSPFWQSPTRPWFLVVAANGEVTAVVPTIGDDGFRRAHVDRVFTWPSPRPEDEGVSLLQQVLADVVPEHGRVGAELGDHMVLRMAATDFQRVQANLSSVGVSVVDGGDVIKRLRLIKSPNEIAKVEATCQAMSAAHERLPRVLSPGMTELEACRAVKRLFLETGADDTPYVICRSGRVSYSDIIGHPTERVLEAGDMLIIDSGCQIDGYFCDFNRNFVFGAPAAEATEVHDRLQEAMEAGLRAIRPGAQFKDIYTAMASSLGIETDEGVGRMGHSVGLQLTEWPSIHPDEATPLEEGMVLSVEPSMALPGGEGRFVVIEEVVAVTASGYRLLSKRAAGTIPEVCSAAPENGSVRIMA